MQTHTAKLPLKIRIAIRDLWDPTTEPSFKRVETVVGIKPIVDPEWSILHATLGGLYNDDTLLTKIIIDLVASWADATAAVCGENEERYGDALVDKMQGRSLQLFLNVSPTKAPALSWSSLRDGFELAIPRTVLDNDLRQWLEDAVRQVLEETAPAEVPPSSMDDELATAATEDWETVHVGTKAAPVTATATPSASAPATRRKIEYLPSPKALPRPDDILLRSPYHLRVQASRTFVAIDASHSPTLELLHDYLKQWCRVNHRRTDEPPLIDITLHQSPFALGQTYDRLELEGALQLSHVLPTVGIVLNLVEGVLGYDLIKCTASTWQYRRTEPFRK